MIVNFEPNQYGVRSIIRHFGLPTLVKSNFMNGA